MMEAIESADIHQNQCVLPSVLTNRSARNLKDEWANAMNLPISQVAKQFACLELKGRLVQVDCRCPTTTIALLHEALHKIDLKYDENIREASHLGEMPALYVFIKNHVIITPYSFSVQECGSSSCKTCKPIHAPDGEVCNLAMQCQPMHLPDPSRARHFYNRDDIFKHFEGKSPSKSLTGLSHLTSNMKNSNMIREKKKRDTAEGGKYLAKSVATLEDYSQRPSSLIISSKISNPILNNTNTYVAASFLKAATVSLP
eukprot:5944493-Ditylum_brightwellii.AAC.1